MVAPSECICRICSGQAKAVYAVREMMFGFRDVFEYFECGNCGCLQIVEAPDLDKYYGESYYSFRLSLKKSRAFVNLSRRFRAKHILRGTVFGKMLSRFDDPYSLLSMYTKIGLRPEDRLLDVGGGNGSHVWRLRQYGVEKALAIDKFLAADVMAGESVVSRKADVFDIDGEFDVVTFHHSFEHLDNPLDVLKRCRAILAPGGRVLIRIPTVSSDAWRTYRENWANLDAPRHFFLHSHDSIAHVAADAGFDVAKLWCDQTSFALWGSEQYRKDIALNDPRSYAPGNVNSVFSPEEIAEFERMTKAANANLVGDCIAVILTPRP